MIFTIVNVEPKYGCVTFGAGPLCRFCVNVFEAMICFSSARVERPGINQDNRRDLKMLFK
jgi:hypothetical protein